MLQITKEQWHELVLTGYATQIQGRPYLLTLDVHGATVLSPARFID